MKASCIWPLCAAVSTGSVLIVNVNLLIVVFLRGLLTFKLFHSAAVEQIKIIQIKTTLSHVKCGKCGYIGSTLYQLSGYWTCARTCVCVCV